MVMTPLIIIAFLILSSMAESMELRSFGSHAVSLTSSSECVSLQLTYGNPKSAGTIVAVLQPEVAPLSVQNFLQYVDAKFYDGTVFHRVIPGFMIQGGGFAHSLYSTSGRASQKSGTRSTIMNEAGAPNDLGTLAMARTNDPNSATSQFFINLADNPFLDKTDSNAGYAVFGHVVSGMDTVRAVGATKTGRMGRYSDVPSDEVLLTKAIRIACP